MPKMFSKREAELNTSKILSKKDASNNHKKILPHSERKTSTTNKQLPSLDEKLEVSDEKFNISSFLQKDLATVKSIDEEMRLAKEDGFKRRIEDARNLFGNDRIDPLKGSMRCRCGRVKLGIGDACPKMCLQCGCCDCRQALLWAERKGGPKVPSDRPLDLWYFENDIKIAFGKTKLKWYKLRIEGKSLRWVAECCYTTMLVHHPSYKNKVFMVYKDAVKFSAEIPFHCDPLVRAGMKEYPPYRLNELTKFPGRASIDPLCINNMQCRVSRLSDPYVRIKSNFDMDSLSDYGKHTNRQGFLKALGEGILCLTDDIKNPIGKTSQQHFDDDGNFTVLGLTECEDLRKSYVLRYI